jgi:endonuclease/exonuclease/phosphatase family metal-dependent hydrolase
MNLSRLPGYLSNDDSINFRLGDYYARPGHSQKFHVHNTRFSLFTQNMALIVFPGNYAGGADINNPHLILELASRRAGAIDEIIFQLKKISPDVAGLCEVFADDERTYIWDQLKEIYPYAQGGPDSFNLNSDGGLLLLSKHVFLETEQFVYPLGTGSDGFANKGFIYIRILPPGFTSPVNIFYTHAQDMDANDDAEEILFFQLKLLGEKIKEKSDPLVPSFIMGDLNIRGDDPGLHLQMIKALGFPVDLWLAAGHKLNDGFTNARENNFFTGEDKPKTDHRLDFILMKADRDFIPVIKQMEVMKFTRNGRNISDHYGLYGRFDELLEVNSF